MDVEWEQVKPTLRRGGDDERELGHRLLTTSAICSADFFARGGGSELLPGSAVPRLAIPSLPHTDVPHLHPVADWPVFRLQSLDQSPAERAPSILPLS